jgi:hypothetical protein
LGARDKFKGDPQLSSWTEELLIFGGESDASPSLPPFIAFLLLLLLLLFDGNKEA